MLEGLMAGLEVSFRCCVSSTISLLDVIRGEADAYLGMVVGAASAPLFHRFVDRAFSRGRV